MVRATLKECGGTGFDATTFVTVYGRTRGRPVLVEDASLSRRGVLAETWICEAYDVIRVDRRVPPQNRDMVILLQWVNIHYNTDPEGRAATAPFDILAEAVERHSALPAPLAEPDRRPGQARRSPGAP
jgi:hypothetical protein